MAKDSKESSLKKKIDFSEYNKYDSNPCYKNEIIDVSVLSEQLLQNSPCKICKQNGLQIHSENHVGPASELGVSCSHCDFAVHFSNTYEITVLDVDKTCFDIKTRLVYGLRCIGKGLLTRQTLCGILNLHLPPTKFSPYNGKLQNKRKKGGI